MAQVDRANYVLDRAEAYVDAPQYVSHTVYVCLKAYQISVGTSGTMRRYLPLTWYADCSRDCYYVY